MIFSIKVKPNSSENQKVLGVLDFWMIKEQPPSKKCSFHQVPWHSVEKTESEEIVVKVKERAEYNKANIAVIKVLSKYYNSTKVKILSGKTSSKKLVSIDLSWLFMYHQKMSRTLVLEHAQDAKLHASWHIKIFKVNNGKKIVEIEPLEKGSQNQRKLICMVK